MKRYWFNPKTSTIKIIRLFEQLTKLLPSVVVYGVVGYLFVLISGCSSQKERLIDQYSAQQSIIETTQFRHLLIDNSSNTGPLVVFIEGDGMPWRHRTQISPDPTPESPLMLALFSRSTFPSIYLGRPCYYSLLDSRCEAYWYTHGRYSEAVVESMIGALRLAFPDQTLVLVGHSGGATLATLMAARMENVMGVMTVAGNLQVKKWAEFHEYSELVGSLDPIDEVSSQTRASYVHLYSPHDQVINSEWIAEYAREQGDATLVQVTVDGHVLGWLEQEKHLWSALESLINRIESSN